MNYIIIIIIIKVQSHSDGVLGGVRGLCFQDTRESMVKFLVKAGAHQKLMEPPSPIQTLGVNPFLSRFIIRTVPRGDLAH